LFFTRKLFLFKDLINLIYIYNVLMYNAHVCTGRRPMLPNRQPHLTYPCNKLYCL